MPDDPTSALWTPTRRQLLATGGLAGLTGLGLVSGCRKAASSGGSDAGNGTLTVGQVGDILPLGPWTGTGSNTNWRGLVLESLGQYDPKSGDVAPLLASSIEPSSDGRMITYTIRDGVHWHTGRAFGPQDVAWTFDFLKTVKQPRPFPQAWLLKLIASTKIDGQRVVVTFKHPVAGSLQVLSGVAILDKETIDAFAKGTKWIGTGQYVAGTYKTMNSLLLTRNEKYWNKDASTAVKKVKIQLFDRGDALLNAFKTGQIQLTSALSERDLASLGSDAKIMKVPHTGKGSGLYLGANVKVKPLDDRRVRQAIAYAVDRKRIAADVFKGQAFATSAPWDVDAPSYSTQTRDFYAHDPDKARSLLRAAGATGASITYQVSAGQTVLTAIAEIVAFDLRQVGLKVKEVLLKPAQTDTLFQKGNFAGLYTAGDGNNGLPASVLISSNRPWSNKKNLFGFAAPEFDTLAAKAVAAVTDADEKTTGDALTRYMMEQAYCTELVINTGQTVSKGVTGYRFNSGNELLLTDAKL